MIHLEIVTANIPFRVTLKTNNVTITLLREEVRHLKVQQSIINKGKKSVPELGLSREKRVYPKTSMKTKRCSMSSRILCQSENRGILPATNREECRAIEAASKTMMKEICLGNLRVKTSAMRQTVGAKGLTKRVFLWRNGKTSLADLCRTRAKGMAGLIVGENASEAVRKYRDCYICLIVFYDNEVAITDQAITAVHHLATG